MQVSDVSLIERNILRDATKPTNFEMWNADTKIISHVKKTNVVKNVKKIFIIITVNNTLIYMSETRIYGIRQQCTNSVCQITMTTEFCTVVPNICGYSVWNLVHVTILVHRILRLLVGFWKFCATLE